MGRDNEEWENALNRCIAGLSRMKRAQLEGISRARRVPIEETVVQVMTNQLRALGYLAERRRMTRN